MEDETKETKTYRFETKVIKHAEKNPLIPSFAEWACDRYKKEFLSVENLVAKMNNYFEMGEECKDRLVKLKKDMKETKLNILNPQELSWIQKEAPNRIKNGTFEGVYKYFTNTFKREDINRKQFKLMVDKFKQ